MTDGLILCRRPIKSRVKYTLTSLLLRLTHIHWQQIFICKHSQIKCTRFQIGKGSRINGPIKIKGNGAVTIGRYCAIGDGVRIIAGNHEIHVAALQYALQSRIVGRPFEMKKRDVHIGHDVWIGDAAIFLPGISIGNGAVIAAGAVVTKDVEPYSIVGGVPARMIGRRCSFELAAMLNGIAWWSWEESKMRKHKELFHPWQDEQEMRDRIARISNEEA